MKPNNFPVRSILDGTEELYTQTNDTPQKFTLDDAKKYSNAIQVTHAELLTLINDAKLITGSHYIIEDYKTCYDQPDYDINGDSVIDSNTYKDNAPIEPIIVMAISENLLAVDAYQPTYPLHKIKYDVNFTQTEATSSPAFGRITERIDELGNRTDYDHVNIKFKRYISYSYIDQAPQTGTIEILSGGLVTGDTTSFTLYTIGEIIAVPSTPEVYFEIVNIVDNTTMYITGGTVSTTATGEVFYLANSDGFISYKATNIVSITPKEYLTFNGVCIDNYIGDFSNYFSLGTFDFLLANNVFLVSSFYGNRFGAFSVNNTIDANDCIGNITKLGVIQNIIIGEFSSNTIGENFNQNYIKFDVFNNNNIGNYFGNNNLFGTDYLNNYINNAYSNNTILGSFYSNDIGYDFKGNFISGDCYNNVIENNFVANELEDGFTDNNIGNNFFSNNIGTNFKGNTIKNNFEDNTIENDFGFLTSSGVTFGNKIGNNFIQNTIGKNFYSNVINNTFTGNTIGSAFTSNEIVNEFTNNVIGNKFNNNNINGRFLSCTITNEFRYNRIEAVLTSALDFSLATHVYATYNCRIFTSNDFNSYLEYFNITTATYVSPTA